MKAESTPTVTALPAPDTTALKERMRTDWDRRAEENARFYIASGAAASDEQFLSSGVADLEEAVLDGVVLDPEAEALEIGCGVGRLLIPLSMKVRGAHGVDISDVMIRKSAEYCASHPNVSAHVTDGTLRAFPDASLDFVFSFIVFQHIPERGPIRSYVEEAARVLKPGGVFRFQVDGRWKKTRSAEITYDGVKFSPDGVKELLRGTPLLVLDEWGAETHYHWVTARREGEPASARAHVARRAFDEVVLAHLLESCGVADPEAAARRVASGAESLRAAIAPLEPSLVGLDNVNLIREVYRRLLGAEPDALELARHLTVLASGYEAHEDFLDIVLMGAELRELVRPFTPEVPWYRLENLRQEIPGLPLQAPFFDVVAAATRHLPALPFDRTVPSAFTLVLGHRPDAAGMSYFGRLFDAHPLGRRLVVRHLLGSPESAPVPPQLDGARRAALLGRAGVEPEGDSEPRAGESFAGEAVVARRLLAGPLNPREFVGKAYSVILGRPVDAGGEAFYPTKLQAREISRPMFLRELLWSAELRQR
jgi:SAM-dependent methyltransferase